MRSYRAHAPPSAGLVTIYSGSSHAHSSHLQIGHIMTSYACTDCYILAHDSSYSHPLNEGLDYWDLTVNPGDISHTDWVCEYGELTTDGGCREPGNPDDICTACDSSGTAYGITVGGHCDLGEHTISGYWEFHTYTA